jgi:hypothetical protein
MNNRGNKYVFQKISLNKKQFFLFINLKIINYEKTYFLLCGTISTFSFTFSGRI